MFVRSGPGKSYDSIASLTNGSDVKIVSSAGDGWYQITFSGNGGKTTTGYMKGDYLPTAEHTLFRQLPGRGAFGGLFPHCQGGKIMV